MGEYCSLITATRADLQNAVRGLDFEQLGHQCHDVGLADGLAATDRQGPIIVSRGLQLRRYKKVPGHLSHGFDDALVIDATPGWHQLLAHHSFAGLSVIII